MQSYHIILILSILLIGYVLTRFLLSLNLHRRIWNVVLLLSFLVCAVLGLILAISLDYKLGLSWYRGMLWYHVEFGIAMTIIGLLHALWHIKYYLNILKR